MQETAARPRPRPPCVDFASVTASIIPGRSFPCRRSRTCPEGTEINGHAPSTTGNGPSVGGGASVMSAGSTVTRTPSRRPSCAMAFRCRVIRRVRFSPRACRRLRLDPLADLIGSGLGVTTKGGDTHGRQGHHRRDQAHRAHRRSNASHRAPRQIPEISRCKFPRFVMSRNAVPLGSVRASGGGTSGPSASRAIPCRSRPACCGPSPPTPGCRTAACLVLTSSTDASLRPSNNSFRPSASKLLSENPMGTTFSLRSP
jgi:hypothetical protein